jgi:DNA repair exonuclease SbcCD ATPase subunit
MDTERRVDLSRLIRLDQVEDIMNKMMERIDAQDETIRSLQKLCGGLLSKQRANDAFESIQDSLVDINIRLEDIKQASTADVDGRALPAGEVASLNSLKTQEIVAAVAKCANHAEVMAKFDQAQAQQERDMAAMHGSLTPLELGKTLHKAQNEAAERMKTMERVVALKIDRSEMTNIETLATSLEEYDYFRKDTQSALQAQKDVNKTHMDHLGAIDGLIAEAAKEREDLQRDVSLRATTVQMERLATMLHGLEVVTTDFASKRALGALETACEAERVRVDSAASAITTLQSEVQVAEAAIATKASIEDMNKRVLRAHYNEVVTALGTDIDTKATKTHLSGVDTRVVTLEERIEAESTRLSVAMRFVDWFTSRGESYEHNLRLVDKHLRGLTKAADPAERQPFAGQVRFTRNDENNRNLPAAGQGNIGTSFSHL